MNSTGLPADLPQQADLLPTLQVRMIFNFIDCAHAQVGRSNSLSQSCRFGLPPRSPEDHRSDHKPYYDKDELERQKVSRIKGQGYANAFELLYLLRRKLWAAVGPS